MEGPWAVPRIFPGASIVCIGGGPSLTQAQVDHCRDRVPAIAINNAYQLAPWASMLYACDAKWWRWHSEALYFAGARITQVKRAADTTAASAAERKKDVSELPPGVLWMDSVAKDGLSHDPRTIHQGRNSGYQAINLAVLLGARRILLLGYDMKRGPKGEHHWHGQHPDNSPPPVNSFLPCYETLPEPLAALRVEVINCTPGSALTMFPTADINEEL